jgi:hypothetical protein
MSAISTAMLEFLHPGDLLLYSTPLYGGTIHFIQHVLTKFGASHRTRVGICRGDHPARRGCGTRRPARDDLHRDAQNRPPAH